MTPRAPRSERAVPRKLGKVGRNVVEQIERSKENDLSRLVYALGIRHVGEKARRDAGPVSSAHGRRSWTRRSRRCRPCRTSARSSRASVRAFADEPHNRALVAKLAAAGVNMTRASPSPARSPRVPWPARPSSLTGTLPR